MTDHADLTARLRRSNEGFFDPVKLEAADLIDSLTRELDEALALTRERDEAAAREARLREGLERSVPWLDYMRDHIASDWSPPEEAVMRADAEFARAVLDSVEVPDADQ